MDMLVLHNPLIVDLQIEHIGQTAMHLLVGENQAVNGFVHVQKRELVQMGFGQQLEQRLVVGIALLLLLFRFEIVQDTLLQVLLHGVQERVRVHALFGREELLGIQGARWILFNLEAARSYVGAENEIEPIVLCPMHEPTKRRCLVLTGLEAFFDIVEQLECGKNEKILVFEQDR